MDFECKYSYFSPSALKNMPPALLSKDSLCWVGDSVVYPRRLSVSWSSTLSVLFRRSFLVKRLAENCYRRSRLHPVAMSVSWEVGRGLVTPCFMNAVYWMGKNAAYLHIVPDGWISHCPYRRLYERNSPGTCLLFRYFAAASFAGHCTLSMVSIPFWREYLQLRDSWG